jgi:plasmid replication initiation protein
MLRLAVSRTKALQQRTQVDLVLDTIGNVSLKDDRALMKFPFFSLEKRSRMEPIIYDDGHVQIRISPGERGIATI